MPQTLARGEALNSDLSAFMAVKRHAQPKEIAGMVAYLVGSEASIVTGAQHTIDGGFGA